MYYLSFVKLKLKLAIEDEIRRDAANRRGRKRDTNKIYRILSIITGKDLEQKPQSAEDIIAKLPEYKEGDIRDYLQFLTKFPKDKPFLETIEKYREVNGKRLSGRARYLYKLNKKYKYLLRKEQTEYMLDANFV